MKFSLGCFKDPIDKRDIPMSLVLPVFAIPISFDFTKLMSPVRNQGREGTCVAFASVTGVKEFQDKKEYHRLIELSPRFLYNLCKKFDGIPYGEGTYPRIAMKILLNYGVCHESFWPYVAQKKSFPKAGADKDALKFKIKAYARIKSQPEMKRSLLVNGPFVAGVKVFESWFTKKVQSAGLILMPKRNEDFVGGHAICIVGYDDKASIFKFKNSWGANWGSDGYGYLPYAYMKKYCSDAWSATDLIQNPKALVKKLNKVVLGASLLLGTPASGRQEAPK